MATHRLCSIPECCKPPLARGLCTTHYHRAWKIGGLTPVRAPDGAAKAYVESIVLAYNGEDCLIWPFPRSRRGGYGQIFVDGKHGSAHRYVCERAHGKPLTSEHEAAHSCGKGHLGCVAPTHLSWKTPAENQADRLIHGTDMRGQKHWAAKLTDHQVREIRTLSASLPQSQISKMFGVTATTINDICKRKSWSHIP